MSGSAAPALISLSQASVSLTSVVVEQPEVPHQEASQCHRQARCLHPMRSSTRGRFKISITFSSQDPAGRLNQRPKENTAAGLLGLGDPVHLSPRSRPNNLQGLETPPTAFKPSHLPPSSSAAGRKPKNNVVVSATIRPEVWRHSPQFAPRRPACVFQGGVFRWMAVRL